MTLTNHQIEFYLDNGYLQIENYFSEEEVATLCAELPNTIERNSPRVILEDNGTVRSIFAPHFVNDVYDRMARLEKMVIPAEQLIGSKVYLHQYKINSKKGLKGDWWEWHQDFPYWHIDDGIGRPDFVTIMLYLQDTNYLNGALLLIPGSHKSGIVKFENKEHLDDSERHEVSNHEENKEYLSSLSADIKFTVDHELIKEMSLANGIVTASGKKGSVLFFHGNTFHASNSNLTPFDRDAVLLTYNSVHNIPRGGQSPRPEFLAGRDYTPIENLAYSLNPLIQTV